MNLHRASRYVAAAAEGHDIDVRPEDREARRISQVEILQPGQTYLFVTQVATTDRDGHLHDNHFPCE